ncbi:MAG: sel1 repeat family protein, partial [Bacteroidales bacterium]|nr:sel1 repeat family protein [Bacteroidales bacterium]
GEPCFLLGQFYENATGEYQSYEKAAYWYRKGDDDFGNLKCIFQLGKLYHYGKGVPKDYDEALRCYVEVRTWGYISYREVQNQIDLLMKDWKETP